MKGQKQICLETDNSVQEQEKNKNKKEIRFGCQQTSTKYFFRRGNFERKMGQK